MATKKPPMFMGKESKMEEGKEKAMKAKSPMAYKNMEAKEGVHGKGKAKPKTK